MDWGTKQFREDVNPVKAGGKRGIRALDNTGRIIWSKAGGKRGIGGPKTIQGGCDSGQGRKKRGIGALDNSGRM